MKSLDVEVYFIFAAIAFVITLIGTVLNSLVLVTFVKTPNLLNCPNIIICSMCVADLLASSTAAPLLFYANLTQSWPFGIAGCKMYAFLTTLCGLTSIIHLAGAAFERYDSFDRAPRGYGLLNEKRTVFLVVLLWIYALIFSVAPLLGWSDYTFENHGTSCAVNWSSSSVAVISHTAVVFLTFFLLPVGIMLFSHYRVWKIVRQIRFNANNIWGNRSAAAMKSSCTQKKMSILIAIMTCVFLTAWTPYALVALISVCGYGHLIPALGSAVPAYVAKLSFTVNPIIYAFLFKSFRKKMFRQLLGCRLSRNSQGPYPQGV